MEPAAQYQGKRNDKFSSYYEIQVPEEPSIAPTATEVEVAATEKAAKEKAATDCRESPGRYAKSLHEMLKLKYHMDWETNMDSLTGFPQHQENFGLDATILQPFKPFNSPGFYQWDSPSVESLQKVPRLKAGFKSLAVMV
jgi:hypothetical protein